MKPKFVPLSTVEFLTRYVCPHCAKPIMQADCISYIGEIKFGYGLAWHLECYRARECSESKAMN